MANHTCRTPVGKVLCDSGSSVHAVGDVSHMRKVRWFAKPRSLGMANANPALAVAEGEVDWQFMTAEGCWVGYTLTMLLVPSFPKPIISYAQFFRTAATAMTPSGNFVLPGHAGTLPLHTRNDQTWLVARCAIHGTPAARSSADEAGGNPVSTPHTNGHATTSATSGTPPPQAGLSEHAHARGSAPATRQRRVEHSNRAPRVCPKLPPALGRAHVLKAEGQRVAAGRRGPAAVPAAPTGTRTQVCRRQVLLQAYARARNERARRKQETLAAGWAQFKLYRAIEKALAGGHVLAANNDK